MKDDFPHYLHDLVFPLLDNRMREHRAEKGQTTTSASYLLRSVGHAPVPTAKINMPPHPTRLINNLGSWVCLPISPGAPTLHADLVFLVIGENQDTILPYAQ